MEGDRVGQEEGGCLCPGQARRGMAYDRVGEREQECECVKRRDRGAGQAHI